jgi:type IV pilus assembly protein PilC
MSVFKYKAIDKDRKTVSGLVEAATESAAVELLHEKDLIIISVKEHSSNIGQRSFLTISSRVKVKDLVIFFRQFSVMISANVAMVEALKIIMNQTANLKLKSIISEMADEIDGGDKLSHALGKRPNIFSRFHVNVIRAGETSGKLDESLIYLADEIEKDYDLSSKIRNAMIYPVFVLCGLCAVGLVMMIFVVPKLTGILTESGTELPIATKILIGTSAFLTGYWWLLAILLIGGGVGLKFGLKTQPGRAAFDALKLRLPVFGKLFKNIYIVRFARSMNTLITGGVTVTDSLKITAEVVNNYSFTTLLEKTVKEVEDGNSISDVFAQSREIPSMVTQMISIGEKTGKLDAILARVADFYAREVDNLVSNLMTLLEPIVMVIMGVAVGIMVAAIILPMYNLASSAQ